MTTTPAEAAISARPAFQTRLTRMLGIDHPILCGGLMWLADARYVASVVNAGAMGFVTPRSYPDIDAFRDGLKLTRELTAGRPFGVNLYISAVPSHNDAMNQFVDVSLEEGVRFFETAGRSPDALLPRLKAADCVVIHKVTEIRHALAAQRLGVDALVFVGTEAGGHPGSNLLSSNFQLAAAWDRLTVPVVLAGGFGSGRQLLSALALGAEGILLGSRMLVAEEVWAHRAYKDRLIEVDEMATRTVLGTMRNTYRCLDNDTARLVAELEENGERDYAVYAPHVGGRAQHEAYASGDWNRGVLSLGPAAVFCDRVEPAADIIGRIVDEAADAFDTLSARRL